MGVLARIIAVLVFATAGLGDVVFVDAVGERFITVYNSETNQIVVRDCLAYSSRMKRPAYECAGSTLAIISRRDLLESLKNSLSTIDGPSLFEITLQIETLRDALENDLVASRPRAESELKRLHGVQQSLVFMTKIVDGAESPGILETINVEDSRLVGFKVQDWLRIVNKTAQTADAEREERLRKVRAILEEIQADIRKARASLNEGFTSQTTSSR